ncbi:MAG: cytochrome c biogenesis protein ResB [Deltaproteobacteria bacterium]|nr:cytochrome c biogenesis protein ResB [Deltaproteobacteria bacterium]
MSKLIEIIFDIFSSLRLTVVLLLIILIYLSISTFIPQDSAYFKYIADNRALLFQILKITGLTNPYHSFFLVLWLFLFTLNLIACTLNRLTAILEKLKRNLNPLYLPTDSMTKSITDFDITDSTRLTEILKNKGYTPIKKDGSDYLILKRGLYSPLNFLFVHLSVLIIITGITVSSLMGYEGFIKITEGRQENLFYREVIRGNYIKIPLPFSLRLNSFSNITISSGQSVDYISDITIFDGKSESGYKIRVNEPLEYKGILFVQSSYEANTEEAVFTIRINDTEGKISEIKKLRLRDETEFLGKKLRITDYFENVHNMGEALKVLYGDSVIIILKNKPEIQNENSGIQIYIEEIKIPYDSILRITYDPGTTAVFAGSILFLISLLLLIFYRFRMIAVKPGNKTEIYFSGKNAESEVSEITILINSNKEKK